MLNLILEILYPTTCGICDTINKNGLCEKCDPKLKEYEIKSITSKDGAISVLQYKDIVRQKIIEYKFGDKPYLYKMFSRIILKNEKICRILQSGYDIIIPVPIHKKREHKRGYNQSLLISKEIAKHIENIKLENNILYKKINTNPQSLLTKTERKTNIKGAFDIKHKEKIYNKNIILFDDIYTTGSTASECKKILKQNGANKILILTIAKD